MIDFLFQVDNGKHFDTLHTSQETEQVSGSISFCLRVPQMKWDEKQRIFFVNTKTWNVYAWNEVLPFGLGS